MRLDRDLARRASSALAILLLASSLTCLTAACRTLCAPPADAAGLASVGTAADAGLPPCHRGPVATGAQGEEPAAPAGGCDAGSPCCAQWLNDHATLRLADPATLRTLLPTGADSPVAAPAVAELAFTSDPPDGGPGFVDDSELPSARPRAAFGTRGPPSLAAAA